MVLSWPDVEASADWDGAGMNLVIHEFAHKIDMRNGDANGCPPLPPDMSPQVWKATLPAAYEDFSARVDRGEDTAIDPYAAESPAEFFAVLSEVFFADPRVLRREYRGVYGQCARFYRQDRRRGWSAAAPVRRSAAPSAPYRRPGEQDHRGEDQRAAGELQRRDRLARARPRPAAP